MIVCADHNKRKPAEQYFEMLLHIMSGKTLQLQHLYASRPAPNLYLWQTLRFENPQPRFYLHETNNMFCFH